MKLFVVVLYEISFTKNIEIKSEGEKLYFTGSYCESISFYERNLQQVVVKHIKQLYKNQVFWFIKI